MGDMNDRGGVRESLTTAQAYVLEQKIEVELSKLLDIPCKVYMALNGKFKVEIGEDEHKSFITFDAQDRIDWIDFKGYYHLLCSYVRRIKSYLWRVKDDIESLLSSSRGRPFLSGEEIE